MQPGNIDWQDEFLAGIRDIAPLAFGVAVYGIAFGMLCSQIAMTGLQTGAMGALVFAGSSQIVAIERIASGAGAGAAILAGLALNLRIFLITASLRPELSGRPWWQKLAGLHLATDENWALMHATRNRGGRAGYWYLIGGGICLIMTWTAATMAGLAGAKFLPEPYMLGMDFAFAAAFIAISCALWRGRRDLLPWFVSISLVIILVLATPIEPSWAMALSGVAGAIAAGLSSVSR